MLIVIWVMILIYNSHNLRSILSIQKSIRSIRFLSMLEMLAKWVRRSRSRNHILVFLGFRPPGKGTWRLGWRWSWLSSIKVRRISRGMIGLFSWPRVANWKYHWMSTLMLASWSMNLSSILGSSRWAPLLKHNGVSSIEGTLASKSSLRLWLSNRPPGLASRLMKSTCKLGKRRLSPWTCRQR